VDRDEILRVLRAFDTAGLEYVLIGATAMGLHGLVRATEDIDLFIKPTAENVDRLRRALSAAYDGDPNVQDIATEDLLGDYPAVRYYPPSGDLYFDILTRLGEFASFDNTEREPKEIEGTMVWVATPAALYRLKKGTVQRPSGRPGPARALRSAGGGAVNRSPRVQRFRSIEEMNATPAIDPRRGDFERFLRHCARYWQLAPRIYPRGVFRFRSIEEAEAARSRHQHQTAPVTSDDLL
jgi:hypothetical protein